MGDTGKAKLLIESHKSPHGHQLKPSLIGILQKAKIVFYIGDILETNLTRAFENLPEMVKKVSMLNQQGLSKFDIREGGGWEGHEHSSHNDSEDNAHKKSEDEHNHEHGDLNDPHIWLDPNNAVVMIKAITRELSAIYPENRSLFKRNALSLISDTETMDKEIKALLMPIKDSPFIVFHDAYQYFETHYNLTAVGSIVLDPTIPTSAKRLRELRQKVASSGVTCIFREPQFSDKLSFVVAEDTAAKLATIDPIGGGLKPGADLYSKLLTRIADGLYACLST
ncbi:MAG: zinc ABC transporter substrate-binding protein [Sneathiella sp.]|nr:zinc ABC transporter substrate-binding protein [Sneathiella sp.]